MSAATNKTGRVTKLADVKGVLEYRFVSSDWAPPKPFCDHVSWFMFDPVKHVDEYERAKKDMAARTDRLKKWCNEDWDGSVRWFSFQNTYVAKVTYDAVERPILVLVGGFSTVGTAP